MSEKGDGHLYLRGSVYWMQYYNNGIRHNESTKQRIEKKAQRILDDRLSDIRRGRFEAPAVRTLTLKQTMDDLETSYKVDGLKSLSRAKSAIKHLTGFFGERCKVQAITTTALNKYVAARLDADVANATIRYELSLLRRAMRLKERENAITKLPYFPMPKVDNARQGFFEEGDYRALLSHLPDDLAPVVTFAYWTGWRIRSEVLTLEWSQVDFQAGIVRIETSKNGEGRVYPFDVAPELSRVLHEQRRKANELGGTSHVFFHETETKEATRKPSEKHIGAPIGYRRYWRESWSDACKAADLDRIPHDFRRTAVRNLERMGVSRSVAMKLVGHKTESMYRRYAIVSEGDLREGVAKLVKGHDYKTTTVPRPALSKIRENRSASSGPGGDRTHDLGIKRSRRPLFGAVTRWRFRVIPPFQLAGAVLR